MHPLNKLKLEGAELVTREELEEALAPIRAALEVSEPEEEWQPSYSNYEPLPPAVEGENEEREAPARKSRKRKPEGVDPLGVVPEEDDS